MSEWKKVKLGEICKISAGGDRPSLVSEKETNHCQIPIYSNGIDNQGLYGFTDKAKIKGNAITITGRGANAGTVFYRETAYYPIIRLLSLVPNNDIINPRYLYYLIKDRTFLSTGSAQPQITVPNISNYEINYNTNLDIQHRIATILSRYDSLIENYQKQIKLLEEAAQRLYKEWFIDLRFPGHENTKIVDGVPEGWEKKRLADIAELKAGGDKPDIVSDVRTEDCAIPIFSNGTTNEGLYGFTKVPEIMEYCVTISARGSVGYTVLRRTPFVPIVRLISVIPHSVYVGYIFYYLKYTTLDSNGAAQQQITIPMIRNKEITIPSKGILEIFESQTEPIFNQIDILKDQIHHLTEARDRLLPKLMSGEIEV